MLWVEVSLFEGNPVLLDLIKSARLADRLWNCWMGSLLGLPTNTNCNARSGSSNKQQPSKSFNGDDGNSSVTSHGSVGAKTGRRSSNKVAH